MWMRQHGADHKAIGDFRKREERLIEKSDNEDTRAADGDRQGLNRVKECFHLRDAAPGRPLRAGAA